MKWRDYPGVPTIISGILISERKSRRIREGHVMMEVESEGSVKNKTRKAIAVVEEGWRISDNKRRQTLEDSRNDSSPVSFTKPSATNTLILA